MLLVLAGWKTEYGDMEVTEKGGLKIGSKVI